MGLHKSDLWVVEGPSCHVQNLGWWFIIEAMISTPWPLLFRSVFALLVFSGLYVSAVLAQDTATTTVPVATSTQAQGAPDTQTDNQATTSPESIAATETAIAERRTEIEAATSVITAETDNRPPSLTERQRTRFTNLAANTSNRLDATVIRLTSIADRTEQRVEKSNQSGYDTASAQRALTAARAATQQAEDALATIDGAVDRFVTSARPRETFPALRQIYTSTHASLLDAHTALRIALNELANAQIIEEPTTTTATSSE